MDVFEDLAARDGISVGVMVAQALELFEVVGDGGCSSGGGRWEREGATGEMEAELAALLLNKSHGIFNWGLREEVKSLSAYTYINMTLNKGKICTVVHGLKPTILMVIAESILGGSNVLYKLAVNEGSDLRILVAYRFLFAAAFMIPIAFYVERGSLFQNLYVVSLDLTSATFATAITNLVTAITFVLALCFRLEKLNWEKASGKAKVMGTLLSLAGAMLLTLYKGPDLFSWNTHLNLVNHGENVVRTHPNMILGAFAALGSITCYALWTNLQGLLATGVLFTMVAWCVHMRGPLFVSAFNPLMVVIVALAGPFVLDENWYLGSVLGGITIICGLYVLLWGKAKEMKTKVQLPKTSSGDMSKPLEIVLTPSQAGASENHEIGVYGENSASVVEANADEQPDEIRIVRK
ncbi:WAT1-related protein At1g68170 [Daucus carota subsp. sativus]|uniref:WAT1-related protein At1g68170 n=1 Tax=Daucus carota subsp. sativus TaxID=79200 RepID=UPI003083EA81